MRCKCIFKNVVPYVYSHNVSFGRHSCASWCILCILKAEHDMKGLRMRTVIEMLCRIKSCIIISISKLQTTSINDPLFATSRGTLAFLVILLFVVWTQTSDFRGGVPPTSANISTVPGKSLDRRTWWDPNGVWCKYTNMLLVLDVLYLVALLSTSLLCRVLCHWFSLHAAMDSGGSEKRDSQRESPALLAVGIHDAAQLPSLRHSCCTMDA